MSVLELLGMTNFEYIKQNITENDLAYYEFPHDLKPNDRPVLFADRIYGAWNKWAESVSSNKGNMAAGNHNGRIIKENPSIWSWQNWSYPDGVWRKKGRSHTISFLVWLSKQYNPEEWIKEIDDGNGSQ